MSGLDDGPAVQSTTGNKDTLETNPHMDVLIRGVLQTVSSTCLQAFLAIMLLDSHLLSCIAFFCAAAFASASPADAIAANPGATR